MSRSDWHDRRGLRDIMGATARILGRDKPADPWRELAVAVIGNALNDIDRNYQPGNKKIKPKALKADAMRFIKSPDLDAWAQFTSIQPEEWREIARRVSSI